MDLDSLQLQITASSGKAVTSVNQLISTLERLDRVNLGNLKSQISSTSAAIQSLSGINAENLKSVASGIRSLGNALTKMTSVGGSAGIIQSIANIRVTNAEQLSGLSQSIRSLGYATSERASKNLPILTRELKNLFATLSQVPKVNANVTGLLNTLTNFNNSLRTVGNTMRTTSGGTASFSSILPTFNRNMTKTHHTVRGLAGQLGKFWATFYIFLRGFQAIGKTIDLSSSLTEVENVVNQTFGGMRSMLDDFTKDSIRQFGMSELAVKQYASRFQAMGSSLGITGSMLQKTSAILEDQAEQYGKNTKNMAEMSMNLTKLTADMASFYDVEQSAVAEDLYSVFTGQTRSLRQYGIDLTQANLKEWAMKKGLDANIESMTQAQKAALRYAYTLDAARFAMGDFARTSNTWHNQITILKANMQQLAILIGTGFINVLKPFVTAFNNAMASVLKAVTAVLNALGKIFGWKYEINMGGVTTDLEDAAGYADDTASGLGDAAKNAKKLKNQLMSFDKLNVITSPSDSSGSGSGSGGAGGGGKVDTSDVISKVQTGEGIFDSEIENLWQLGDKIAEKLAEMLENIDWQKAYKGAINFGKGLADFLNGLFVGENGKRLFFDLGKSIAKAVNTVMNAAETFANVFRFGGFGKSLSEGIRGFLENWQANLTGRTFGKFIGGLANTLYAVVSDKENWSLLGHKIAYGINGVISGLGKRDLDTGKTGWEALFGDVASIASGLANSIGTALKEINWDEAFKGLWSGIKQFMKDLTPEGAALLIGAVTIKLFGKKIAAGILSKMVGKDGLLTLAFSGIKVKIGEQIGKAALRASLIKEGICSALGISPSALTGTLLSGYTLAGVAITALIVWDVKSGNQQKRAEKLGKDSEDEAKSNFAASTASSYTSSQQTANVDMWIFQTLFGKSKSEVEKEASETGNKIGQQVTNGVHEGMKTPSAQSASNSVFENIKKSLQIAFGIHSPAENMKPIGENIVLGVLEGFSLVDFNAKMNEWWNTNVEPWFTVEKWSTLGQNMITAFNTKWQELKEWWSTSTFVLWWEEDVAPWFSLEKWQELVSSIGESLKTEWNGFSKNWKTDIKAWWDKDVSPWFTKKKWEDMMKNVTTAMKGGFQAGAKYAVGAVNAVIRGAQNMVNRVIDALNTIQVSIPDWVPQIGGRKFGVHLNHITLSPVVAEFANGGFPTIGSVFVAGEAGAEMVGNINGKTGVASGQEITGIRDAIENSSYREQDMLRRAISLLEGIYAKEFSISADDVASSTRNVADEYFNRTGRPYFAM